MRGERHPPQRADRHRKEGTVKITRSRNLLAAAVAFETYWELWELWELVGIVGIGVNRVLPVLLE
jgi:hypothetical protein